MTRRCCYEKAKGIIWEAKFEQKHYNIVYANYN